MYMYNVHEKMGVLQKKRLSNTYMYMYIHVHAIQWYSGRVVIVVSTLVKLSVQTHGIVSIYVVNALYNQCTCKGSRNTIA